jgi:hypothetical protein
VDHLPNPKVWLALIRAEGVNGTWVMCPNGDSGKPGNTPEYVALHWHRELCIDFYFSHTRGTKMDTKIFYLCIYLFFLTEQGAAATADLLQ